MLQLLPALTSIPGLMGKGAMSAAGNAAPGILGGLQQMIQQDPMTFLQMGGALMQPGDAGSALMRAGMIGAQGQQRRRDQERQQAQDKRIARLDENQMDQQQRMWDWRESGRELDQSNRVEDIDRENRFRAQEMGFRRERADVSDNQWERGFERDSEQFDRQFAAAQQPGYASPRFVEDGDGNDYVLHSPESPNAPPVITTLDGRRLAPQEVQALNIQPPTSLQQTQDIGAPRETEFARFRAGELAMGNTLAHVDRLQQIATQDPTAITAGGALSADLQGLADNAMRTMDLMINGNQSGEDRSEEAASVNRAINIGSNFQGLGMEELNAQTRSIVVSLAYARAKQADPSGRISDRDLRAQIESLGIGSWTRTPEQIGAVLGMVRDESVDAYNRHGQQMYGDRWMSEGMFEQGLRQYAPGVNPLRYTDPDAYTASLLGEQ